MRGLRALSFCSLGYHEYSYSEFGSKSMWASHRGRMHVLRSITTVQSSNRAYGLNLYVSKRYLFEVRSQGNMNEFVESKFNSQLHWVHWNNKQEVVDASQKDAAFYIVQSCRSYKQRVWSVKY